MFQMAETYKVTEKRGDTFLSKSDENEFCCFLTNIVYSQEFLDYFCTCKQGGGGIFSFDALGWKQIKLHENLSLW